MCMLLKVFNTEGAHGNFMPYLITPEQVADWMVGRPLPDAEGREETGD